ncbi:MAG: hypothetical protein EA407_11830 [Rhodobacteraceae bacterium]|nr:MAG: hypothetical protein EA407_11830 [Paracoccaceae bacterium]
MDLRETSPIPSAALPVAALRDHLRLSSGFSDDTTQDGLLEQYLRAAIASIEARVSRALFRRGYVLRLARWRNGYAERLPIAPVASVESVTLIDRTGAETIVDPEHYSLDADGMHPRLEAAGTTLPGIPARGAVEIAFTAGFGVVWDDIPADLRQAVLLLAAQYYESREAGGDEDMGFAVRVLLERWRDLRLGARA